MAPFGKYTAPNRGRGFAALCARAVNAGTMASSSGRPTTAPMPDRKVRRGTNFLVTYMGSPRNSECLSLDPHLKRRAADDAAHDRREPVVVLLRVADDPADHRHVGRVET